METRIAKAYGDESKDREIMEEAGRLIRSGALVGMPTETVYGLAGDALNPRSSRKIYEAKGRPSDNPLIVHIAEKEAIKRITEELPEKAEILMEAFWPGPLTMVLRKSAAVPEETTGGLDTVAVRMPVNKIALELIKAGGGYIAAPSANSSGRPSCTTAAHVYEDLKGRIPLIIDGGKVGIGLESTIVDLTGEKPCLLRPGYISREMLEEKIGEIDVDPSIEGVMDEKEHPKAPGMKYKHYSPKGELYIVKGKSDNVIGSINRWAAENREKGLKTGVLTVSEREDRYKADIIRALGAENDGESIAANLFLALREMDDCRADMIYSEEFQVPGIGDAIMNRLVRAAGHKILEV